MRKNVPAAARFTVVISGADPADAQVNELAGHLEELDTEVVVVTRNDDPGAAAS